MKTNSHVKSDYSRIFSSSLSLTIWKNWKLRSPCHVFIDRTGGHCPGVSPTAYVTSLFFLPLSPILS